MNLSNRYKNFLWLDKFIEGRKRKKEFYGNEDYRNC